MKKRLLIVDDEELIRKGISKILSRQDCGFEIIGEAANGVEAEALALDLKPDLIITDVRMPQMDGLTLIARLAPHLVSTRYIVLSGYDEFDYVQKALRHGVVDYILKPISAKDLYELLERVGTLVEQDCISNLSRLQKADDHTMSLQQSVFWEVLQNKGSPSSVHHLTSCLSCTSADTVVEIVTPDWNNALCPKEWRGEQETFIFSLHNILKDYLFEHQLGIAIKYKFYIFLLLMPTDSQALKSCNRTLSALILQILKMPVNISVGSTSTQADMIYKSYEDALQVEKYRFFTAYSGTVYFAAAPPLAPRIRLMDFSLKHELDLVNCFEKGEESSICHVVENFSTEAKASLVRPEDVFYCSLHMIDAITSSAAALGYDITEIFPPREQIALALESTTTIDAHNQLLVQFLLEAFNRMKSDSSYGSRKIIGAARQYIKAHFHEPIGLAEVSAHIYVSPKYLSDVFKKQTGENFLDYLIKMRIEHAKSLLKQPGLKIYEISCQVGYKNPQHFMKLFKKTTGVTPSEYRDGLL